MTAEHKCFYSVVPDTNIIKLHSANGAREGVELLRRAESPLAAKAEVERKNRQLGISEKEIFNILYPELNSHERELEIEDTER